MILDKINGVQLVQCPLEENIWDVLYLTIGMYYVKFLFNTGILIFLLSIYAVGGRDDCMELSSAERYNPHTNSWSPIVAMTSRRSGVCIYNN